MGGQVEERQNDSKNISELGKRANRRAKPISQRTYGPEGRSAPVPFVLFWFLSLLGDFGREGQREWRRKRERERETPCLPLSLEATLCRAMLLFHLKTRLREERDSHFKRQFDLRITHENNLKEDLRKQLKGEHKGHTVTRCWTVKSGNPKVRTEEELEQGHETLDSLNFADGPILLWSCHLSQAQNRTECYYARENRLVQCKNDISQ